MGIMLVILGQALNGLSSMMMKLVRLRIICWNRYGGTRASPNVHTCCSIHYELPHVVLFTMNWHIYIYHITSTIYMSIHITYKHNHPCLPHICVRATTSYSSPLGWISLSIPRYTTTGIPIFLVSYLARRWLVPFWGKRSITEG